MKDLYDLLLSRRRRLAVYNPEESADLDAVQSLLSAYGVHLSVVDADVVTQPGFCVLYDDSGVLTTTTVAELEQYADVDRSFDGTSTPTALSVVEPEATVIVEESVPKLVAISRELESLAWRGEGDASGRLVAGFQELSTFTNERTQGVYDRIARLGVDVTVCGYPDVEVDESAIDVYEDRDRRFVDSWFVLYTGTERKGALVAKEVEPGTFTGLWTRNSPLVDQLFATLDSTYPELG